MSSSPLGRMISFRPFMPFRVNSLFCWVFFFSFGNFYVAWTSSLWHYQQSLHPPDQLFKSLFYVRNLSGCLASNQHIHSFSCFAKGRVCSRTSKWTGWTTRAIERDRGYFATLPLSASILGCLLNGISQSSCRKPLGEDWGGAVGLFNFGLPLQIPSERFSQVPLNCSCFRLDCLSCSGVPERIPWKSMTQRWPCRENKQITRKSRSLPWTSTPSTKFGQLLQA